LETNRILFFLVAVWTVASLVRLVRGGARRSRGWIAVNAFVLGAMGTTRFALPGLEGFVGLGVWGTLYLAPALGSRRMGRLILAGRYDAAERTARVLAWLHPADGWRQQPRLVRAMALAARGRTDEAAAALAEFGPDGTVISRSAAIQLLKLQGRWDELRDMLGADLGREAVRRDRVAAGVYVRALGETGDPAGMVEAFAGLRPFIEASPAGNRAMARMVILAFAGRVAAVERLLGGPLSALKEYAGEFWLGTAALAAGKSEEGLARLELALESDSMDELGRAAVRRRLADPPPVAEGALSPEAVAVIDRLERDCAEEERYGTGAVAGAARPYGTYALLAANLAYYGAEIALGGGEDIIALFRLGALMREAVVDDGQWWRVAASAFLHAGGTHLALNMFALLVLGPFVERVLGAARFAAVYVAAGLGAAGLYLLLAGEGELAVGASGCIMGLVGATAAILLRGWWSERARVARKRLVWIGVIVAVQVAFDILTPVVSMSMHTAGLVTGFAAGMALFRPGATEPDDA
jgi:rhomboid protease GluP